MSVPLLFVPSSRHAERRRKKPDASDTPDVHPASRKKMQKEGKGMSNQQVEHNAGYAHRNSMAALTIVRSPRRGSGFVEARISAPRSSLRYLL